MPNSGHIGKIPLDHDFARRRIAAAVRRQVGQGAPHTAAQVSTRTGVAVRTINNIAEEGASKSVVHLLLMMDALGEEFTNEIISLAGYGGAHRAGVADVTSLSVNAGLADLIGMIARHLEDGTIDHVEIREQLPAARRLHALLGAFIQKYEHPAYDAEPHLAVQRARVA